MSLRPTIAAVLALLFPGVGHLYLGKGAKAGYFAALVLLLFGVGLVVSEGAAVSPVRAPIHLYGQYLAAIPAYLAETMAGAEPVGRTIDRLELGVVMTTVAGIMNLIVAVDAYETARHDERGGRPAGARS